MVAYKQPVLRTEIEAIRGVDCAGVLKTLLDHRLIKIVGRRDVIGRPIVYGTTREFLEYFGLKDLTELPTLKEFEELVQPPPLVTTADDAQAGGAPPEGGSSVTGREPLLTAQSPPQHPS
jgi:segregation and condensation protein B